MIDNLSEIFINNKPYTLMSDVHIPLHYEDGSYHETLASLKDTTGRILYMIKDGADYQLCGLCSELPSCDLSGYEETMAYFIDQERTMAEFPDQVEHAAFRHLTVAKELVWCKARNLGVSDASDPFTNSRELMYLRGSDSKPIAVFYLQLLVKECNGVYYSATFPAAEIKRNKVAPASIPHHLTLPSYRVVLGLSAALAYLSFNEVVGLSIDYEYWFLLVGIGATFYRVAGREAKAYVTSHLISTAFSLFFLSHILDNHWVTILPPEEAVNLIVFKAAALLAFLVGLRGCFRRVYFLVADAAITTCWISFFCYTLGWIIGNLMENLPLKDTLSFTWYDGTSWWGYAWLILYVLLLFGLRQDYLKYPNSVNTFLSQLEKLRTILVEGPTAVRMHNQERLASSLLSGIRFSDKPEITIFYNYVDTLVYVEKMLDKIAEIADPEESFDMKMLAADLKVLSNDLGVLVSNRHKSLESLRLSPQVRVLLD